MKTSTLLLRQILNSGFMTTLAFVPGLTMGGDKPLEPPAAVSVAIPIGGEPQELRIIDGELIRPGGKVEATLPNVVDALRDQYPEANIVLSPSLAKLKVGDLKLRAGRLAEELEAVRIASGEKFDVQLPSQLPQQIDPTTGLPVGGAKTSNAGLFVLRAAKPNAQNQRVVEAFNISPYIEWLRQQPKDTGRGTTEEAPGADQIQDMIMMTLRDFEGDTANTDLPSFRYHRGTSLLIVIGSSDAVEVARKIVNALPGMSSVSEDARARFGLESKRFGSAAERTARDRADDAFRARYGLAPRTTAPAPSGQAPEDSPQK